MTNFTIEVIMKETEENITNIMKITVIITDRDAAPEGSPGAGIDIQIFTPCT
jgi:hypothetical protein